MDVINSNGDTSDKNVYLCSSERERCYKLQRRYFRLLVIQLDWHGNACYKLQRRYFRLGLAAISSFLKKRYKLQRRYFRQFVLYRINRVFYVINSNGDTSDPILLLKEVLSLRYKLQRRYFRPVTAR